MLAEMAVLIALMPPPSEAVSIHADIPPVALKGTPIREITIGLRNEDGSQVREAREVRIRGIRIEGTPEGEEIVLRLEGGDRVLAEVLVTSSPVRIEAGEAVLEIPVHRIPGWLSLLPALLAIGLAIATREVLLSLFAGIWIGATVILGYNPLKGFLASLDTYPVNAITDRDNAMIILFTLTLSGMVGLMARAGGTRGLAEIFARHARTVRSGQVSAFLLGMVIFFDDYANSLLVGNTLRPLTDRLRISREKLAYIVDSTAAPVAGLALISTWVGFEVGVIQGAIEPLGYGEGSAFRIFIDSIPYRFYSVLAIVMVFFVAWSGRDFGPMLRAERRAHREGKVLSDTAVPLLDRAVTDLEGEADVRPRWVLAAIPILTLIGVGALGIGWTGWGALSDGDSARSALASLRIVVENSDPFRSLFWAAAAGSVVAAGMALAVRSLNLKETVGGWMTGVRAMVLAMAILVLAWSIKGICDDLMTGDYVVGLTRGWLTPEWLPTVIFLAAAGISFATGTSYGTMGILMPIAVPLAASLGGGDESVLVATIGSVLAGAIFGDHCSPISDTTVLSSVASASDHIDHVRTQIPYALLVAGASILLGCVPVGFGLSPWIGIALGAGALWFTLRLIGKSRE